MHTKCDTETSCNTSSKTETELDCNSDNKIDSSFQPEYDEVTDSISEETDAKYLKFIMFFSSLFPMHVMSNVI